MATETTTHSSAGTGSLPLQVVVVTPERAVLDERADMVILPMVDGELGVLRGRAALVGRLGKGQLRVKRGSETKTWQLEGGFAQVRSDVVTVLTTKVSQ
jgi:F-type H+-transporting ATPase subunit epsilon